MAIDPATIAAVSAAGVNIGTSIFGQKRNVRLQEQANMRLADYQNQLNLQNWHLQNEYNSPSSQMQRYADAGLNPNLIYGSGSSSSGNASSVSPASAYQTDVRRHVPQFNTGDFVQFISAFQDLKLKRAQVDNVQAQTDSVREQIATEPIRRLALSLGNDRSTIDNRIASTLENHQYEVAKLNRQQLRKNLSRTDWDILEAQSRNLSRESERSLIPLRRDNLNQDLFAKAWENNLRKQGLNPKHNPIYQLLGNLLSEFVGSDNSSVLNSFTAPVSTFGSNIGNKIADYLYPNPGTGRRKFSFIGPGGRLISF